MSVNPNCKRIPQLLLHGLRKEAAYNLNRKETLKDRLAKEFFNNICFVCNKKYRPNKGFAIHHIRYKKGEMIYKDFINTQIYHYYLEKRIRENPADFALLCRKHHWAVEKFKKYNQATMQRIMHCMGEK